MNQKKSLGHDEKGFVLVASLLILLILVIIGVAATTTSTIEIQIATNEKIHRETFYQADGGAELASRITFENALCVNMGGFAANPPGVNGGRLIGNVEVINLNFAEPTGGAAPLPSDGPPPVRDAVYYPGNMADNNPHTNMTMVGRTESVPGEDIGQVVGYEGPGKGGGARVLYTINSQHRGAVNSESIIGIGWNMNTNLMKSASSSDCKYD
ncbi:MAG: PilX N-terminal domain-containing pilus assembly protein [Thermodesulfobacteriota bacterium]